MTRQWAPSIRSHEMKAILASAPGASGASNVRRDAGPLRSDTHDHPITVGVTHAFGG